MKNKKQIDNSDASDVSDVEKRVDDMMNLDRINTDDQPKISRTKNTQQDPIVEDKKTDQMAPIDIFADLKSAPEISPELVKQMSIAEPDAVHETDPVATEASSVPDLNTIQDFDSVKDPETDKVVDELIKEEADNVLDAEDGKVIKPTIAPKAQKKVKSLRMLVAAWWNNQWARYATIALIVLIITVAAVVPTTRYSVLNLVGVKATASIKILDGTTKLPLKNVEVSVGDVQTLTDKMGIAKLQKVPLGTQTVTIHKVAFGDVTQTVVIGLGANALSPQNLRAVGNQYHFVITDFLSGKLVTSSEANSGLASAVSDTTGRIILTSAVTADSLKVTISAVGYRSETVTMPVGTTAVTPVQLVSSRPNIFVSKASGKYDVYKVDIDGKNRQVVLPGSGLETAKMGLVWHATDPVVAVVSTRDNLRNSDGYLLDALNIVNTSTSKTLTLDHAEKIQLVDWLGDKIVYVRIKAGTSAGSPERYQLESYDYKTLQHIELAHANNFSDVVSARGSVYYAASNDYEGGTSLFGKVSADGTGKTTLLTAEVYNIFWLDYNDLNLASAQDWYTFHIGATQATKLASAPPSGDANKLYVDSPNHTKAAWVESRDGQGVLSIHDDASNKDTVIISAVGLGYPVRWLDSTTLVYRVTSPTETADYVISTAGGTAKKVTDLTNVPGVGRWYYY